MAYNSGVKYMLREATLWAAVAAIGFTGVYYFDDLRLFAAKTIATVVSNAEVVVNEFEAEPRKSMSGFESSVTLKANQGGHFYARAHINGHPVAIMVDTGATVVALKYEDAEQLDLLPFSSDYTHTTLTANGIGRVAPVILDSVRIGDVEVSDLRGSIAEPGKQHITLLGMAFIRKLSRFELRGRELVLVE
jgi:aspartyl protease family protein